MNNLYRYVFVTALTFAGIAPRGYAQQGAYSWASLPVVNTPQFKKDTFNITTFGAKPDGITLNTASINNAILQCSKQGGGVVLIPQGVWLSGPVVLQSNVNLHISRAALLQFTGDRSQYRLIEGNFEGRKTIRNESPVSGDGLTNVAITGDGVIDGNGEVWRPLKKDKVTEGEWKAFIASGGVLSEDGRTWYPSEAARKGDVDKDFKGKTIADYQTIKDFLRPNMVVLTNCRNVLLQQTTFQNSPAWCLHVIQSEHVTFDGIKVRNLPSAQNGDGIDIESCAYAEVKNCTLDCGDDGICIKSGKDEEGRKTGKASRYIIVRNNVVYRAHGGFVIGSEMSGGVHDIFVTDCIFIGTDIGLRFKTTRGRGGIVENIFIRNVTMHNIVHDAILFDMYYAGKAQTLAQTNGKTVIPAVNEGTPQFRKFFIDNVVCEGAGRAMLLRGLPEMNIKDIHFTNLVLKAKTGIDMMEASNIDMKNIKLECTQSKPLINVENSRALSFHSLQSLKAADVFFSINGDRSESINVLQTDFSVAKDRVLFNYGAEQSVFTTGQ